MLEGKVRIFVVLWDLPCAEWARLKRRIIRATLLVARLWKRFYPIGVLPALAPEPEVSARITPD